jgi:small subunit ribosomal protein S2
MKKTPDVIFIIDVVKESIAIAEANRLHIPVVALVDTNADPASVMFPIPSNDDAARTIRLFCSAVADAINDGRALQAARFPQQGGGEQREVANGSHAATGTEGGVAVA